MLLACCKSQCAPYATDSKNLASKPAMTKTTKAGLSACTVIWIGLWVGLFSWRINRELRAPKVFSTSGQVVGSSWDPRGRARVDEVARQRESDAFRERMRKGLPKVFG